MKNVKLILDIQEINSTTEQNDCVKFTRYHAAKYVGQTGFDECRPFDDIEVIINYPHLGDIPEKIEIEVKPVNYLKQCGQ